MKKIVALEDLVRKAEERVKLYRRQLSEHEAGINRLSRVVKASTEINLEKVTEQLVEYKKTLEELLAQDQVELEKKERIEAQIARKKYFDNQKNRIHARRDYPSDVKLEILMILDELPEEILLEDEKLFDIALKSLELNLKEHEEINDKLIEIKKEFEDILKKEKGEEHIKDLGLLQYKIPVLILHFHILLLNIREVLEEKTKEAQLKDKEPPKAFSGFPKYEDWWINELWNSHQAYFALFKWRDIIYGQCITYEQRKSWTTIFNSWVFIKKMLNDKNELAFSYNYAFDKLIAKYAELEEELADINLESMENIIRKITKAEDFTSVMPNHSIITPYLRYKRTRETPPKKENPKEKK